MLIVETLFPLLAGISHYFSANAVIINAELNQHVEHVPGVLRLDADRTLTFSLKSNERISRTVGMLIGETTYRQDGKRFHYWQIPPRWETFPL